ncbi:MAG: serine/threonine-protein kinase, partial [Polyangiales bacterium]
MSAPVDPSARKRIGSVIGRRFRLEQLIGVGGMGAVYVARATNDYCYAVKLLLNPTYIDDQELVARFVREGKVTAQLDAPNITKVYELAVDTKTRSPFIVMELLDGCDVQSLVARLGPIHPQTAVRIAIQAARGLAVAHAAGIVHRDIKPGNLFLHHAPVEEAGPQGRSVQVKVCDFGIAKAILADTSDAMTATGALLGTPLYMSPEQIRSARRVDARSDLWSLAMTLYAMLAGRPPLDDVMSITDLLVSITTKPIRWLQDYAPWIDPGLARVIHGALVRDLDPRCPSAEAWIEALLPYAGGTEELFDSDLVRVPAAMRDAAAPVGTAANSWAESVPHGDATLEGTIDPAVQELVGQTLSGRYRLERVLGVGGMGAVYESTSDDGTRVAVKVILGDPEKQRPDLLRRFVREARATMAIESPNVVRIVDVDNDAQRGFPFIVMELLDGTDLDRLVKKYGALEPEPVVKAFLQACNGLAAAHAKSIVHRDIKP